MKDRVFIDTNIWVYASLDSQKEGVKRMISVELIDRYKTIFVSTQVLNEFYSVLLKNGFPDDRIIVFLNDIISNTFVIPQNIEIVKFAWSLKLKYKCSLWDSLIIASALQNNCSVLFSEDLQHNQTINGSLKIINPFI